MDNIIVSFCIATFRRYQILKDLVMEILSVNSNRIEVVVCDNCSGDDSIDKIKSFHDQRLHVYENSVNLGAMRNMYEALEHGNGKYLFYINDRDNINSQKIENLLVILEALDQNNVAFAKCLYNTLPNHEYRIYPFGEKAFLEFSCVIAHPTGYIFRKDVWKKIRIRNKLFEKECYGDYPFTMICAIMSFKYNGAYIYGDICDVRRERMNFFKEKSRFYQGRKDKRLWHSPEVHWRELKISYYFLKKINVEENLIEKLLYLRYKTYLQRVVIKYKSIISQPCNTVHYGYFIPDNQWYIYVKEMKNGLYLWRRMQSFSRFKNKKELLKKINNYTKEVYNDYFEEIFRELLKII